MQNIIKDLGQINYRIFDHTSAVQGEVKNFVDQFEPKISNEFDQMLQLSHSLNEANDADAVKLFHTIGGAEKIITKLDAVSAMLEKLVKKGVGVEGGILPGSTVTPNSSYFHRVSDEQSKELSRFIDDINEKRRLVDKDFEQKIVELRDHFEQLDRETSNVDQTSK